MTLPYSTHDPDKGYSGIVFRDDRDLLHSELNEMQDIQNDHARLANDVHFREGGRLEGAEIVIQPHPTDNTKVRCQITRGKIYMRGLVRVIPASQVDVPNTGQHNIGLLMTENLITAQDPVIGDPTLVHPQTGDLVGERIKPTYQWVVDNDSATRVFTLRNGSQIINDLPPDLNAAEQLDIRRTIDLVGNILVEGGKSDIFDVNSTTFKVTTSPLKAYVEGIELVLPTPRDTIVPKALTTREVEGESFVYATGTATYTLASNPVKQVNAVRANVTKSDNITKGTANGVDNIPNTPVVSVTSVTQGATTYVAGVDFQRNGNTIDWSLGGAEPSPGSTYTVNYVYRKTMTPTTDYLVTKTYNAFRQYYHVIDFTPGGDNPDNGSSFEVDYDIYLSRRDVLALDKHGDIILLPGIPKEYNAFPPAVPPDMLKLADIVVPAGEDFENVRMKNADNYVLSALELRTFLRRFENLEYNMALEDLDKEVLSNEQITNKRGIFTDPFTTSLKGDLYRRLVNPTTGPTLVTTTTGGTFPASTTYYFKYAWGNKNGATLPSPVAQVTTGGAGSTHKVQVYLPPAPINATRAYVYMSTTGVTDPDSFKLIAKLETTPVETEPEKNLAYDEGFEGNFAFSALSGGLVDAKYWHGVLSGTAAATTPFVLEKTSAMITDKVTLKTNVTNSGTTRASVLLYNDGDGITKAVATTHKWRMSFKAKTGSGTATVDYLPAQTSAGVDLFTAASASLTTTAQTFTADFTPTTTDTAARFAVFKMGNNSTTVIYIDDVVVSRMTEFTITAPTFLDATIVTNAINTAFEFTAAYGLHEGIMCNGIFKYQYDMEPLVDEANTTAVGGRQYWHLPYSLIESINQPKATSTMPVNPYEVYNRASMLLLMPAEDTIPEVKDPPVVPPQPIKFPVWHSSCEWNNVNQYLPKIQPDTMIRIMTHTGRNRGDQLLFESPWKDKGEDLFAYTSRLREKEAPQAREVHYDKVNNILTVYVSESGQANPTTWINKFNSITPTTGAASTGKLPSAGQQTQGNDILQPTMRVREVTITGKRFIANSADLHCTFAGVPVDLTPVSPTVAGVDWQDPRTNRFFKTVNADANGDFKAKFTIPEGIPAGERDVIVENALNKSITVYKANGKWMQRLNQEVQIGEATTREGMFNRYTPVAQSIQYDTDRIIGKIGVYFRTKSTTGAPITLQVRNMVNGYPGTEVYATSTVAASAVNISTNGSAVTEFVLDDILWLKANTPYALCLITDSIEYNVWIAELGLTDVATNQPVSTNPYIGVLFSSSNNTTWTAHQASDLKFKVWECSFTTPATLAFDNITGFQAATFFMTATHLLPPGTAVKWEMSDDNGATWFEFQPFVETFYGELATQAKLRAILSTTDTRLTPFINKGSLTFSNFVWYTPTVYITKNINYAAFGVDYDTVRGFLYEKVPSTGRVEVWITPNDGTNWFKLDDTFTRNIDGDWKDKERELLFSAGNPRDQFRLMIKFYTADGLMPACVGRLRTVQSKENP